VQEGRKNLLSLILVSKQMLSYLEKDALSLKALGDAEYAYIYRSNVYAGKPVVEGGEYYIQGKEEIFYDKINSRYILWLYCLFLNFKFPFEYFSASYMQLYLGLFKKWKNIKFSTKSTFSATCTFNLGANSLTFSSVLDTDPDPHGSALRWPPWIRIRICNREGEFWIRIRIRDADSGSGSRSYKITKKLKNIKYFL